MSELKVFIESTQEAREALRRLRSVSNMMMYKIAEKAILEYENRYFSTQAKKSRTARLKRQEAERGE